MALTLTPFVPDVYLIAVNFCSLEDGTIVKNINLKQFARESGQQINNMIIQEVCAVQPMMEELDLSDCVEVSDVGLWSLARHCTRIKALTLSGCHQLTQIGLRSISLRCCEITTLNFNYCHLLDDIALTVIATGAWKLQILLLRGCVGITDTGKKVSPSPRNSCNYNRCLNMCAHVIDQA